MMDCLLNCTWIDVGIWMVTRYLDVMETVAAAAGKADCISVLHLRQELVCNIISSCPLDSKFRSFILYFHHPRGKKNSAE